MAEYRTKSSEGFMPRSIKCTLAALLFFSLAALKPVTAQRPNLDPEFIIPEFFISVSPSVVMVEQGGLTMLTVTIRCNTSSFEAVKDCNGRPKFDLYISEFPDGTSAQTAGGRIGDNTISINTSSEAKVGLFPVQVTVAAGTTTQMQTFVLNIRHAAAASSTETAAREPVAIPSSHQLTWEHHAVVAKTPEELNRVANDLGKASWELVSVVSRQNAHGTELIGFFRRPKPDDAKVQRAFSP
ncbi:MAG TPA: hypothetical protein VFQ41_17715 [Candidatus Angelobacter sp.]|nr:hypothetical protein [Candidatus Angelobacter sp.]